MPWGKSTPSLRPERPRELARLVFSRTDRGAERRRWPPQEDSNDWLRNRGPQTPGQQSRGPQLLAPHCEVLDAVAVDLDADAGPIGRHFDPAIPVHGPLGGDDVLLPVALAGREVAPGQELLDHPQAELVQGLEARDVLLTVGVVASAILDRRTVPSDGVGRPSRRSVLVL
jgi:hypothetical protein